MQGYGVPNEGLFAGSTGDFACHAWPFGGTGDYKRLVFGFTRVRRAAEIPTNLILEARP